jgi:hypothetical protein
LATTAAWSDLVGELDQWRHCGRVATLWWRDDDAVTASRQLDRLISISGEVSISLAVIPATADARLAALIDDLPRSPRGARLSVLQHGWCHANRAVFGKKNEFPAERSCHAVKSELAAGRERLTVLFGTRALPVLVPPWNRIASRFLPLLPACGFGAISCVKPRRDVSPVPGVTEVNVHVDLVAWTENHAFIGEGAALGGIVGHLKARRLAKVDAQEPTGILTHHLVQDDATDAFLCRLVAITGEHPAARWIAAAEVFANPLCPER